MGGWLRGKGPDEIQEKTVNGVTVLYFPALEETGMVKHAFSTREGGVSTGQWSTMNFSFSRGDDPEHVRENYRRMAGVLKVEPDSFVVSEQEHTTNLLVAGEKERGSGVAFPRPYRCIDGLLTDRKDLTLVTFYADCIPLWFADTKTGAIALSHSGWRGTIAGMGRVTVERMKKEYGTDPADIVACIGPGICRDCYEIGEELYHRFMEEFTAGDPREILTPVSKGHSHLDLLTANRMILEQAGIPASSIHVSNICTRCNPDRLFSHRFAGEKRGNLAAFLARNSE